MAAPGRQVATGRFGQGIRIHKVCEDDYPINWVIITPMT
jgi:hypothetical protein